MAKNKYGQSAINLQNFGQNLYGLGSSSAPVSGLAEGIGRGIQGLLGGVMVRKAQGQMESDAEARRKAVENILKSQYGGGEQEASPLAQVMGGGTPMSPGEEMGDVAQGGQLAQAMAAAPTQQQNPELARMLALAEYDPDMAISMAMQPGQGGYEMLTPEQVQAMGFQPGTVAQRGPQGQVDILAKPQQSTAAGPMTKGLPTGYMWDETGTRAMPIPGISRGGGGGQAQPAIRYMTGQQLIDSGMAQPGMVDPAQTYEQNQKSGMLKKADLLPEQEAEKTGSKPFTQAQGMAATYANRMTSASKVIDQFEDVGTDVEQSIKSAVPGLGNFLVTPERQQLDQANRNFLNAVLRRESGAAISDTEFANGRIQYFPQPGDSPEVLAQKRRNRADALQGIKSEAGPAWERLQEIRESEEGAQPIAGARIIDETAIQQQQPQLPQQAPTAAGAQPVVGAQIVDETAIQAQQPQQAPDISMIVSDPVQLQSLANNPDQLQAIADQYGEEALDQILMALQGG